MNLRATFLLIIAYCIFYTLNAQTVIWSESFDPVPTGAAAWSLVNPFGANGADPNFWVINDNEGGVAPTGCGVANNGNNTMHVTSVFFPSGGAAYDAGGLCGILFCPETHVRAQSPNISTIGQSNLTLEFDYIANGGGGPDHASVWYNSGSGWTILVANLIDAVPICGSGQGMWHHFTVALPASANNIANLQIGFGWENNDDGVGTDPSVAINDVEITTPSVSGPTASFSSTDSTLCLGDCINFNDLSTGSPIAWTWYFPGAATTTSSSQNPINICYNTAGTFDVSLVVDDGSTTDSLYMPGFITVNPLPTVVANASPATTVCNGDMVTLTGSGATTYTWDNGVTDGVAFAAGATTTYTVTGTDANGCMNTDQVLITVNNCSQPTASFTADSLTICAGGDILFTDNSTGSGITTWTWTFPGGAPPNANTQGPHNVTFASPGTYNINLQVTDANGTDDTTIVVTVTNCTSVNAAFTTSSNSICAGDSIVFTDASSAGVTIWQWDFDSTGVGGANPSTAINQGPHTVFYNTPGSYVVELIVFDGTNFDTTSTTITVSDCSPTANFAANGSTTLCEGDSISFNDLSTGSPTTWNWSFPGGTPSSATGSNPGFITYPGAGTYSVTLTVSNPYGTDSITMTSLITVNVCTAPTAGITMDDGDGEICVNNCIDFSYNAGSGGTPTTIAWSFPGGTPDTSNVLNPGLVCWNDTTGIFNVTLSVSNANGSSNASTTVIVHEEPVVSAGPDTSITIGANGNLGAVATDTSGNVLSGGTYTWTPATDLSCSSCQNTIVIQPLSTDVYTVTYTDQYGCVVSDDVLLNVDIAYNIGVPSAFSPNGDGSNDLLLVRGKIVIKTLNFTIYNRYGQQVFSTTDVDEGWDGTHNGKEVNPGVFVYYVNVTFIDGSSGQLKGNVTLVR